MKELWAYAYSTNNTEKSMGLKMKPYKCVMRESKRSYWSTEECVPLKQNGEQAKSGIVSANSRDYADTYEEAVKGYNDLVYGQIDFLMRLAKRSSDELIEIISESTCTNTDSML